MAKRVTAEDVKQRLITVENRYKVELYSEVVYFNGSKSTIKHKCIDCGEFKTSNLKNLERGMGLICLKCAAVRSSQKKLLSKEIILEKIKQIDASIISEFGVSSVPRIKYYNGSESILEHNCLLCNNIKESNYGNYISKTGLFCRYCSYKNLSLNMMLNPDLLLSKLIRKHGDCKFQFIDEYIGRNSLFSFNCTNCSKNLSRSFNSLIEGYPLCNECLIIQRSKKLALSQNEVTSIIESENCIWLSGEYNNNRSILTIQCQCGNNFNCTLSEFKDGQIKCTSCSKAKSLGETLLEEVIYFYCKEFNFTYKYQKSFSDLKSKSDVLLRFDFEIFNNVNTIKLIEYNGPQHYEFIKFFHSSYEDFLEGQKNDLLKEEYCKANEYNLLVIPYYQLLNCQNILMQNLQFSTDLQHKFYNTIKETRNHLWKNQFILVFTINKRYIGSYRTISEIVLYLSSKDFNISHGDISACLSARRNQAKGLIFINYCDLDKLDSKIDYIKKQKPGLFYMVKLTPVYNNEDFLVMSVKDATSFLGLNKSSRITQACNKNKEIISKNKRFVNGYICEWINCPPYEVFIA